MRINSGKFIESFDTNGKLRFYTFSPRSLQELSLKLNDDLIAMLQQAYYQIGILEGMVRQIPNVDQFLQLMSRYEAYRSCIIDKISCDFYDVLRQAPIVDSTKNVLNCHEAYMSLKGGRFRLQLLYNIHKSVMADISSGTGAVRDDVFLMHPQYFTNMPEYNPPLPYEIIDLLQDFEIFMNEGNGIDTLVKAALAYYQFETIHPFDAGNGRVGRLLPTAILMSKNVLTRGSLFLSEYLYQHNDECIDLFRGIQDWGNYSDWIRFFLQGVIASAQRTIHQFEGMAALRKKNAAHAKRNQKSELSMSRVHDYIECHPVFTAKEMGETLGIAYNTAANRIEHLLKLNIVTQVNQQSRNRLFAYKTYLDIISIE